MIPFLAKTVYGLGLRVRNREIMRKFAFLKESERWSLEKLKQHQYQELRKLLELAQKSPFYNKFYKENEVNTDDIGSLDELNKLPIVSKATLLENSKHIQIPNFTGSLVRSETSGSTGQPLVFYRDKEWDGWVNASVFRGMSWHSVHPWERNGYLWGFNIAGLKRFRVRFEDALQNRFRLFSYDREELRAFALKLKNATYLSGYSSMIYELAKLANEEGISLKNLRFVKGTSEKIHETYQLEAQRAFGRRIVSEYGSAEGGIIAFECEHHKMHINMESVIVEQVNDEIILTNLVSKSFPVIRYSLGDTITLNQSETCDCGRQHETLAEVTGRTGAKIRGRTRQFPSLTLYYVFKNLALVHGLVVSYTCLQESVGEMIVTLDKALGEDQEQLLRTEFEKYFGNDITVVLKVEKVRAEVRSKKKDFVSLLTDKN